jgi:hypothetical protein
MGRNAKRTVYLPWENRMIIQFNYKMLKKVNSLLKQNDKLDEALPEEILRFWE